MVVEVKEFLNNKSYLNNIINGEKVVEVIEHKNKEPELVYYHKRPACFDIETTNLHNIKASFMYIWMFQIDEYTVIGRTWEEFSEFVKTVQDAFKATKLVIYVHNLSFEFMFLTGIHDFAPDDVFAIESRKVLKCVWNNFEFRDSYRLSNMSLKMFCETFHVEHSKKSGVVFDYDVIRTAETKLTPEELEYCYNDVIGLQEAIEAIMKRDGDTVVTIPLTSTGYVRRDVRQAMEAAGEDWKLKVKNKYGDKRLPDYETYLLLNAAFRGGNTHANRDYAGREVHNVQSFDRSSSYPDVMVNQLFPMSRWFSPEAESGGDLAALMSRGYGFVALISLKDASLKNEEDGFPYIPKDKCLKLLWNKETDNDNGRVLRADYLEIAVTDVDYRIISKQYNAKIKVLNCRASKLGKLPEALTNKVKEYYTGKTALKGDESQEELYQKLKAFLNSIYGMTVQDPCKITFDWTGEQFKAVETSDADYNKNQRNAFLSYAWGVWVSAYGREMLQDAIELIDSQGFEVVYCDTDSVKFFDPAYAMGAVDSPRSPDLSSYNDKRRADSLKNGAYADDIHGERHFMGVLEDEGTALDFITMGAKKYAYRKAKKANAKRSPEDIEDLKRTCKKYGIDPRAVDDCDIYLTVSGVNKVLGGIELFAMGGLDKFEIGTVFTMAGGTESAYLGKKEIGIKCPEYVNINGENIHITNCIYIGPSTYTLGVSDVYYNVANFGELALMKMNKDVERQDKIYEIL